jgi:hypothetical protein
MTTPYTGGSPTNFQLLGGQTPTQILQRTSQAVPYLLANTDTDDNVYLGTSSTITPGGPDTFTIEPLGTIAVTSASAWWACTDDPGGSNQTDLPDPVLAVLPGGTNWAPSPAQIAEVIAPLAAAIASQIAQTGIPLVANPQQLYNISAAGSGGTGTGLFGASIKTASGQTPLQAEQTWQSNAVVGRPVKTMKIYQSELGKGSGNNNWTTTATPSITACIALGARACLCYSPTFDAVTGAGTPTAKANMAASIAALSALLTGGGAPAPVVTLWQEPQVTRNGFTAATYKACVQYYANTDGNGTGVRALAPLFYDGEGFRSDLAASYYPGSAFIDGIAADYYGGDFFSGKSLDVWHQLDPTKPFGVWEAGNSASGGNPSQAQMTAYLVGTSPPGNVPSVLQELTSILAAGGTVDSFMWYQDDGNPTGPNYISSSADYRVGLLQQINDAIVATAPSPGLSIAPGATVTLAPINPSPGGGYAPAVGISYDVVINAIAGAGSTIPFMEAQFFWHNVDVPGSLSITRQSFFFPMGATGTSGTVIQGQGPQSGVLVAVKVKNLDTVAGFLNFQMASVSRQQASHRWYWNSGGSVAVPSFLAPDGATPVTVAPGGIDQKSMAVLSPNITAGAKKAFLCGMWTGNAWIRIQNVGTFDVVVQEPFGDQQILWHGDSSTTGELDVTFPCPRSPLLIEITNNGATGSINVNMEMVD